MAHKPYGQRWVEMMFLIDAASPVTLTGDAAMAVRLQADMPMVFRLSSDVCEKRDANTKETMVRAEEAHV